MASLWLVGAEVAAALRLHWAPVFARPRGRPEVDDELAMHLPADKVRAFGPPSLRKALPLPSWKVDETPLLARMGSDTPFGPLQVLDFILLSRRTS